MISRRVRHTLLVVGCGDVGQRVVRLLAHQRQGGLRVLALARSNASACALRKLGVRVVEGDLAQAHTLARLRGLADWALHLAPPPAAGQRDIHTRNLLQALSRCSRVQRLVYASTTGVYGDTQGAWCDEATRLNPGTDRARRRVDAEGAVRLWGQQHGVPTCVLRVPGIYAADREGGHPALRLLRGTPVLHAAEDVYTNHIHADDLARACVRALWAPMAGWRTVNVCDDTQLRMGEYMDTAAELCGLQRPPRISREQAAEQLSPMALSFWNESRRLRNERMKQVLRLNLRYPDVRTGLLAGWVGRAPDPVSDPI